MKRCLIAFAASGLILGLGLASMGEEKVKVQVGPGGVKVDAPGVGIAAPAGEGPRVAARAPATRAMRASKVIGLEVKNAANESLGKINDLVIDDKGAVRYAALSHGGVLGVGSKLFAVPYRVLALKTNIDNDSPYFELNVDKALLEKAPGFASDKWPDSGDEAFYREVDTFYLNTESRK
ncbi:MAG: PRC-barrel domain-containing protein [Pirellulaceae bacterium]|nr:PRC-barrel domain-containing protein [Pirellulaceae bacterium]